MKLYKVTIVQKFIISKVSFSSFTNIYIYLFILLISSNFFFLVANCQNFAQDIFKALNLQSEFSKMSGPVGKIKKKKVKKNKIIKIIKNKK